jgi:CheY-like chemotaxis protein
MEIPTLDWQNPSTWIVLVVDDEPDNLEVVAETLEFHGVTVKTASNGQDALTVLNGFTPNLILLDLSMPKMNGWETRTRIKSDTQTAPIPIIALTAHAMAGDADRALSAGFDGYMIKPINILTLINDIRAAVANRALVNRALANPAVPGETPPGQPAPTQTVLNPISAAGTSELTHAPGNNHIANKEPLTS